MNSEVIQFSCGHCQHVLTVPAHLAGISGPCPVCGNTVTSPAPTISQPSVFAPPAFGGQTPVSAPSPAAQTPSHPAFPPAQPSMAPQPPPAWQSPGFGQMMQELSAQPPAGAMPTATPTAQTGFLPPRRGAGQVPFTGSLQGTSIPNLAPRPQQTAWGSGPSLPPLEPAPLPSRTHSGPSHSSLIPGSPTLPMMGGVDAAPAGTLLSRGIPSAPLSSPSAPTMTESGQEPGAHLSLPPTAGYSSSRSRPLHKPKRATNVFMIGLALLFLGGFLVAAGWLFREPIQQAIALAKGLISGAGSIHEVAEAEPAATTGAAGKTGPEGTPAATPATPPAENKPVLPKASFDPEEATPQSLSATPPALPEDAPMIRKAEASTTPDTAGLAKEPSAEASPAMVATKADSTSAPQQAAPPASQNQPRLMDNVTEEAKPAAEALKKFLSARSLDERLQHTLAADVMKPIMQRYYSSNSEGPILVDAIALVRYDPKPQIGGGAHAVFGLESKTWEFPVPVMLEMNEGRFKVDWLSFVEFKDRLLEKFLSEPQEGPARFHVGITRTHYFEDKVPNTAAKDAFRISPAPPNPFTSVIFVEKESDLGRELRDKIPWGAQVWAIVELEWMKAGPQQWVQLSGVPQLNWYSVPAAPKAGIPAPRNSSFADDPQVPTETQKAVPVGR